MAGSGRLPDYLVQFSPENDGMTMVLSQEHQLHEQVHIRMRLLRLQQGAHRRGAPRLALPPALRRDLAQDAGSLGARRV